MRNLRFRGINLLVVAVIVVNVAAQTGGSYDLSHTVIASGGGSNSTGASYSVDGTVGQPLAGTQSSNSTYSIRGGFWAFQSLAPTAAGVSISGRILTSDEAGIRNVRLVLTDLSNGNVRIALSSSFGYYMFEDVPVGRAYTITISSKRYLFDPDSRFINLVDELTDVDFIAQPSK